ncbi:MAG TPA: hypothetical protein VME24_04595 [Alphaproteobacteria bacterium]|nr:hypothetical protein [Alphaproteobacteria bacterium]
MTHHSSNPVIDAVIIIAFVVLGLVGAAQRRKKDVDRSLELKFLSERLGFENFDPAPNPQFITAWGFLHCLTLGENRYAFNILEGTYHDQKLFVFDYHFQTGSGKDQDHRYYTIFMLIVPEAFSKILIRPQDMLGRIEGVFDAENIKFESAEFSKHYQVHCGDRKFAYDVCNPQMMEYLLANTGLSVEIQGPVISLTFTPQLPVSDIEPNLQRVAQIRALLPQYLFSKQ